MQDNEREVVVLEQRIDEQGPRVTEAEARRTRKPTAQRTEADGRIECPGEPPHATSNKKPSVLATNWSRKPRNCRCSTRRWPTIGRAQDEAVQLNLPVHRDRRRLPQGMRELKVNRENRQERLTLMHEDEADPDRDDETAPVRREGARRQPATSYRDRRRDMLHQLAARPSGITDLEVFLQDLQDELADKGLGRREAAAGRLEMFTRLQEDYEGYGEGASYVLTQHDERSDVLGGLGDGLQVDGEVDGRPSRSCCGEMLDAVVVDESNTAADLANELRQQAAGPGHLPVSVSGPIAADGGRGARWERRQPWTWSPAWTDRAAPPAAGLLARHLVLCERRRTGAKPPPAPRVAAVPLVCLSRHRPHRHQRRPGARREPGSAVR